MLFTPKGLVSVVLGGFFVGFGTAYAGGCTSGHAISGLADLQRLRLKTLSGEPITIPPKSLGLGVRYAAGGTIFGLGWALAGACPGPLFALLGNGVTVMIVAIASALAGTWWYGFLRPRLPH